MFKKLIQNIAVLAMIATIFGSITNTDIDTSSNDANAGIQVCSDLETPGMKH